MAKTGDLKYSEHAPGKARHKNILKNLVKSFFLSQIVPEMTCQLGQECPKKGILTEGRGSVQFNSLYQPSL
jgi:hypothetical protein